MLLSESLYLRLLTTSINNYDHVHYDNDIVSDNLSDMAGESPVETYDHNQIIRISNTNVAGDNNSLSQIIYLTGLETTHNRRSIH